MGGMTAVETLTSGENNTTYDAGYVRTGSIGDFVWEDTNGNGAQDGNEPGIGGVTVVLTGTDGQGNPVSAWWYNPRDGGARHIGTFPNSGERGFTPVVHDHGERTAGDDAEERGGVAARDAHRVEHLDGGEDDHHRDQRQRRDHAVPPEGQEGQRRDCQTDTDGHCGQ